MLKKCRTLLIKAVAIMVCVSFMVPCTVAAATVPGVQPCASDYLGGYQTYICPMGSGEIQVWFNVVGAGTQDELGALSIRIYESTDQQTWTCKETFLHDQCEGMLAYNTFRHMSYVSYQGVAGRYYKAYVCVWGGSDGNGDTRYFWASPELAT